ADGADEVRAARPAVVDGGQDRRSDALGHGAVGCAEAAAARLSRVLHRMGRERRHAVRGRRVRVRSQAGRSQLTSTARLVLVATSLYWLSGVVSPAATATAPASKFDTRSVDFAIAFSGEVSAYRELSTFVLPGTRFSVEAVNGPPGDYTAHTSTGAVSAHGARSWQWRPPLGPGMYDLTTAGPS